jgi:acetolactate synthase-1/2/3 large subunit
MAEQMTGAEMVVRALTDQGVEHIFGYPGGAVLPIYDAIFQQDKVQHILVRHEQGATHMAEGYARSTGKCGVVLVTSGPGATNAVTGLADALLDSIPMVCITGQVPTALIGSDAFQECDTVGITRNCTKHNYLVKSIEDLPRVLHEAFHIATSGRPGPVVIDIPKDVQFALGNYVGPQAEMSHPTYKPQREGNIDAIRAAVDLMLRAEHWRWRYQLGRRSEPHSARAGRTHWLPRHFNADGSWSIPRIKQAVDRHARHARHLRSQHGYA